MENLKRIGVYGKDITSSVLIASRLEAIYNSKGYATKTRKIGVGSSYIILENLTTIETIEIEIIDNIEDNYFDKIYTNIEKENEILEKLKRIGKEVTNKIEL